MSATDDLVAVGAPIALRDGSHVRVRQGRRSDRELLLRGFRRLSPESRYRRFLVPMPKLTGAVVRHLTDIDHHDHEAMIALDEQGTEAFGVARYVRDPRTRPRSPSPSSTTGRDAASARCCSRRSALARARRASARSPRGCWPATRR